MLTEVMVAVGIMMVIGSGLVNALYQINTITARGAAHLETEADLRTSMQWLARDFRRATASDLTDGAPPVSCAALAPGACLTLDWTNEYAEASASHTISYAIVGAELKRTYDGVTMTVARNVSAVHVSLQGRLVTVTLASAGNGWMGTSK
jgi:hypothetical protein